MSTMSINYLNKIDAMVGARSVLRWLCFGLFLSSIQCLQLDGLSTKKPRISKYSKTTLEPGFPTSTSGTLRTLTAGIYRVVGGNDAPCILLKTDALIAISYTNKLGERVESDLYIPTDANTEGNCKDEDAESMSIDFKGFTLDMTFAKTPGGERWYVDSLRLTFNASLPPLEHAAVAGARVRLGTAGRRALLFPTPVGKSYVCESEKQVDLDNLDNGATGDMKAKLFLRELQLQAFMYKAKGTFGPTYDCASGGGLRDETAPIAVGATLAIAVLCTVVGYSIWRYIKIKKVQYDTME